MPSKAAVDDFLSQRTLALAGASRSGRKFGNTVCRELRAKGYRILAVHPQAREIEGETAYSALRELPGPVDGVILTTPPRATETLAQEALDLGIRRIWMQQGASSPAAIALCREKGVEPIHGECILMFAEPLGWIHRLHRGLWRICGRLPR
jgi:hypothetical protein